MNKLLYLLLLWLLLPLGGALAQSGIYGTSQVHPGGHAGVYASLTFVSGYVITPRQLPNDNISWQPAAAHSGASDASHVNGYAGKWGTTAFTFPIGNGTTYRLAGISAPASGTFAAAYFGSNASSATLPAGAPFSTASRGAGVTDVSTVEYWDINGPSAVNLTLSWDAASNLNTLAGGTLSNLAIVGWNGTQWVNLGGTPTGTLSGTGTITTTAPVTPDTYTAYTFGAVAQPPTVAISSPAVNGTATTTPTISGTATPNAVVTITGGPGSTGGPVSVTADGSGNYSTTALTFPTGLNSVTAVASNGAGTSSPAISSFSVVAPPGTTCGIVIHGPTNVEILPGGHMAVYCDVTFISGYVDTPRPTLNDNIIFMPGTTYEGASDVSHVNGYVEKVGNTAFIFPVGDGTTLRPVGMSAPTSVTSAFQAAYYSTNPSSATLPTGAPFSTSATGTGVTAVSPVEYWDVNGAEPVNLTFTWNPASNLNTLAGGTLSKLVIVGWNGSQWVSLGGTPTGTLSGTGTITTTTPITPDTYTAYTFGVAGSCATPTVAGTASFTANPLCSVANAGTISLTGQVGTITRWETSTDNGTSWTPIANTTVSLPFTNAQNGQQYRAVIQNGAACAEAFSAPATITTSATACSTDCQVPVGVITK